MIEENTFREIDFGESGNIYSNLFFNFYWPDCPMLFISKITIYFHSVFALTFFYILVGIAYIYFLYFTYSYKSRKTTPWGMEIHKIKFTDL